MEEKGYIIEDWANFFQAMDVGNWDMYTEQAIGFPQLSPWILVEMTEGAVLLDRNPYYYKVDTEGQQLPYIDSLISTRVDNTDMVNTRGIAGDADFLRQDPSLAMVPLYKENEAAGNYRVVLLQHHTGISYKLNFTNPEPAWNEVVNDVRFRKALNLATDQDEILQFVYNTFGQESLITPWEYDLDAANALLDEMGMTEYDAEGYRLSPSGLPLKVLVEAFDGNPDMVPIAEYLIEYLKDMKINSQLEILSGELLNEHYNANTTMIVPERTNANLWASGAWTDWTPDVRWGIEWMRWYNTTDEFEGIEPPAEVKRLFELAEMRGRAVSGSPEDTALYQEVIQSYLDNYWQIMPVQRWDTLIFNADLMNVAEGSEKSIGSNTAGELWWFDR
jgi:peptide/nickel transport system substrate-binding protein